MSVTDTFYSLVKPLTGFTRMTTRCHGITALDVAAAPTFADLWPCLYDRLRDGIVIAYNASFDLYAVEKALDNARILPPNIRYADALPVVRQLLDLDSYSLSYVAQSFGIVYNAHNALSDAETTARVLLELMRAYDLGDVGDLFDLCNVSLDTTFDNEYIPELDEKNLAASPYSAPSPRVPIPEHLCALDRFAGMNVVITGDISGFTREDVVAIVERLGGVRKTCVSKKTRFLIDGRQDVSTLCAGSSSSLKHQRAIELIAEGVPIEIIDEAEFLRIISDL